MHTIAITNFKGGVAKTTTAVNIATIYAEQGKRVLLIDLDPQASATDFYGLYDIALEEHRTSIELLYGGAPVADIESESAPFSLTGPMPPPGGFSLPFSPRIARG